ncbi:MAG: ATP-binding cassette domain-containing protein [Clostridia bacterium]|nr:ATP-binding cassette domain-containing protein [Clostridia bacterium]MBP5460435.1 ATP-binding cassette domain-containing protein [Clostridia bacterium]
MIKISGLKKQLSDAFTLSVGDLQIMDGERVALIGMNGSGKSTLLRLIAGELEPDEGTIECTGPAKSIGYEPQSPYVFRGTVRSNILLGAKDLGEEALDELLEKCQLTELKDKKSSELSGGEKQRMCFTRMLAGNWPTLLLDEPLSAVDIQTARGLENALVDHCKEHGTTLLLSTHLPAQAMAVSTKVLLMDGGKVIEYTDTEQFRTPKTDFAKEFIAQWDIRQ